MKRRKFNYFYRIENLINGNFYYGIHKTDNLDDGYMGSGVRINKAIKKYGKENFIKEIVLLFDNYEEARNYEKEYVNEQLLMDSSCYNLQVGGGGGFINKEHQMKCSLNGAIAQAEKFKNDVNYRERMLKIRSEQWKYMHKIGVFKYGIYCVGTHHSKETIEKMKQTHTLNKHQQGEKNSQYGTIWINNEITSKKIHKNETIPEGWKKGRLYKRKNPKNKKNS